MSLWTVYLLRCADGSLYTGVTNDLPKRLATHRAGKASKYTRSRLPVKLVCAFGRWRARGSALRMELRIKAMSRTEKLALVRYGPGTGPQRTLRRIPTNGPDFTSKRSRLRSP